MFTQDFKKFRLAIGSVLAVMMLYVIANACLLGIASRVEAGGNVYPYKQQDWLRYLLPSLFGDTGRERLLLAGPSTARENFLFERFAESFPRHRVFQGSLSLGTFGDVLTSLSYVQRVYGDAAVPSVMVLGISPRFIAEIPDKRPFAIGLNNYSPHFGIVIDSFGDQHLEPLSTLTGAVKRARFVTQRQSIRYRTALRAVAQQMLPTEIDRAVTESRMSRMLLSSGLTRLVGVADWLDRGPNTVLMNHISPYKYRDALRVGDEDLGNWLDNPASWWDAVYNWDAAAKDAETSARIRRFLDHVNDLDIELYIVNLPERSISRDRYQPGNYDRYMAIVNREFAGVPLLDLREALHDEEFHDAEHATLAGAARVTDMTIAFVRLHRELAASGGGGIRD